MINKKVISFKHFQGSHGVVLEFFMRVKSHAPTALNNSVMHNKSMLIHNSSYILSFHNNNNNLFLGRSHLNKIDELDHCEVVNS